ncbi:MAG: dipeptidyl peptidase 3 [Tannerella sp.]|nr:dipeptidyl peptidase 3 [Tannerella sp.]
MSETEKGISGAAVDRFADIQVLRYEVPGFEMLPLRQKQLIYHLSEAALCGRDILFDQNCSYNLPIRRRLEAVYTQYTGDRDNPEFLALETYLKRLWFANGIHHHYGEDKFRPDFSPAFLDEQLRNFPDPAADRFREAVYPVLFDPAVLPKRCVQSGDLDLVRASAVNYYAGGLGREEVEAFYARMKKPDDPAPLSYGLNSSLVKRADGGIEEQVWHLGGMYGKAIEGIVGHLERAIPFAENKRQEAVIRKLLDYYRSGDLKTFDDYSILWVGDTASEVDFVNGFIETYADPLGLKASWEANVNYIDKDASRRTRLISENAQWFEDRSPIDPRFRKPQVKGVSAKVINVAMLGGDCYPSTPIGINLPNADWIRRDYGSKSVTIGNITRAYDKAAEGNGFHEEFVWSEAERDLLRRYGNLTDDLHTDLHECLGHGSGQLLPGVDPDALGAYGSTLEEARADLFALYYLADDKLLELGILPDKEAYKAEYYSYLMNGLLTQLVRIEPGKQVEEAHMRNRQLIARWVFEQGKPARTVELKSREGKTYVFINDYRRLRDLFGRLLAEVQRIKSEGDYRAARALVETYGVQVDPALHKEVRARYARLNLAPYKGFVNPRMYEVRDKSGQVVDIRLDYTETYVEQMLRYSRDYSFAL